MPLSIADRLGAIRHTLANLNIDAFIQPRADEYLGEYVPEANERLEWLTGFTGSAGAAIVMADTAAIFIDGRYTVQVRQQVDSHLFEYQSLTELPLTDYLIQTLTTSSTVAVDARLHTFAWFQQAKAQLAQAGIALVAIDTNPIDASWHDRPAMPSHPAMLFSDRSAGATSLEKRQLIGEKINAQGAEWALITALDSCAWLLNLRGRDIPRLPVLLGTGLLAANGDMRFFTDINKLPSDVLAHVGTGVDFYPEAQLSEHIQGLKGKRLFADSHTANAASQLLAQAAGAILVDASDPVALIKACKNPQELAGMRACHVRDGLAVTRFLAWLDSEVAAECLHDEAELAAKLESFRRQDEQYIEPSFDTISAAGGNAAMCHYNHLNGTPAQLPMNSLYLVDSGGQYLDGTTDVTRTVAIGEVSDEHKLMVTLVLKGHIALDQARFPRGTTGQQLDALARQYLWQYGYDYDHGTGHGVGHCLSVHEGPQRIGKNSNATPLMAGMILSNEPGYYRDHAFGIRIENLVEVQACQQLADSERSMLEFSPLTLIPIDTRLVEKSLLTPKEIQWLNHYHSQVFSAHAKQLSGAELAWLTQATAAI
ncbi:aminopeptidase P family protein [Shewanella sp. NIFS-20-20]|uniref:aminopeptidase P family protein n=1 Tax=Shewanella sp. NIFS-20-20 TaxID=2853806 RepID=UPI001C4808C0|nr:aminopeptidase P family protein [Shewanella sp. NIFS-20-20]MBV7314497.1 aminopeptidase P family protein [Shewanella sp. NIFS-20-20]